MNIAFFTDTWLPNVDGVVNSMILQKAELEARGNKVFIFASGTTHDKTNNESRDVFVHAGVRVPTYPEYKLALFPIPTALKQVKDAKIDVIHSHAIASMGIAAITAAKYRKLPLIGTFHTMVPQAAKYVTTSATGQKLLSKAAWKAITIFYNPFDLVIAPSDTIKRELVKQGIKRVTTVPNGIDPSRFNPMVNGERVRRKLGAKERKIVLVAGRMGFEKNIDVLIRSAGRVLEEEEDTLFLVTGKGPAKTRCEKLADELGLSKEQIRFEGFVPNEELPEYYAACDVFATASTFETQCLALYEAMACGKPVVGADALAIPEAIDEGYNGFVFEAGNPEDCAEKLLRVLKAPKSERKGWERHARRKAEEKSVQASVDLLLEAYEGELARKS